MAKTSLSSEERKRREEAFRYACASVSLEGFKVGEKEKQHAQRFIDGEITLKQYLKGLDDLDDAEDVRIAEQH